MTLTSSDKAWMTLVGGVISWNVFCDPGMTLSERMDDWLISRPIVTRIAVIALAAHLINAVPERVDIVHQGFVVLRLTRTTGSIRGGFRWRGRSVQ